LNNFLCFCCCIVKSNIFKDRAIKKMNILRNNTD